MLRDLDDELCVCCDASTPAVHRARGLRYFGLACLPGDFSVFMHERCSRPNLPPRLRAGGPWGHAGLELTSSWCCRVLVHHFATLRLPRMGDACTMVWSFLMERWSHPHGIDLVDSSFERQIFIWIKHTLGRRRHQCRVVSVYGIGSQPG